MQFKVWSAPKEPSILLAYNSHISVKHCVVKSLFKSEKMIKFLIKKIGKKVGEMGLVNKKR